MKNFIITAVLILQSFLLLAQTSEVSLQETASSFMRQGDYANAIVILNRAITNAPEDISLSKDLARCYFYQKDFDKALETILPLLDHPAVDDQSFQIAGSIYKQLRKARDCEKVYKKGLKKFPNSGPLYNELGEILWAQQNYNAIDQWEKGIERDPSYSKNYYNAARYYFLTTDKVWGILYGEIFLNMEPKSSFTPEMKQVLLESYKKLFTEADLLSSYKGRNKFVQAYLETMNKQSQLARTGINAETLTMIRTRFLLDWQNKGYGKKYPFRLFEYYQQLLREGMFDAYNQWIFGAAQSLTGYQSWLSVHGSENEEFLKFQSGRIFKINNKEYYQK